MVTHYVHQTYAIEHKREILFNDLEQIPCAKIRDAVNFIFNNIERNLSVEEIAQAGDMSQFHFFRMFKKTIGMSATRFHMVQRLEKAKDMLVNSEKPIAGIASDLGFFSQDYFSTNFSKYIGQTPAKFRRTQQR
ncbi:MAG: AraC family transcriptional regulator [Candidatus Caenarcaniphilales bacterium]|nr:AraC family transcriptional regulator [Candidatus Caenarcaniphilales bacterium]